MGTRKLTGDLFRCKPLLKTTFVLQLYRILSANGRASAKMIEKRQKVEIFQHFGDFIEN
jgi:hypothetical protein